MAYGVIKKNAVAAKTNNALNRRGVQATAIENGSVAQLLTYSATAGESNVFAATAVASDAGLTNLWMAATEGVVSVAVNGKTYKGLSQDPRDFINPANLVLDFFKPQVGDIIEMTADAVGGTKGANTHVVATAGQAKLQWATAAVSGLSLKYMGDSYISIADGQIATQRVTTYRFEVVAIA